MDKYFLIKIIFNDGESGYLIGMEKGKIAIMETVTADAMVFDSREDGDRWAMENKLHERKDCTFFVISSLALMDSVPGAAPIKKPMFYVCNDKGLKIFYSHVREEYFLSDRKHLYCVWNEGDAWEGLKSLPQFKNEILETKPLNN